MKLKYRVFILFLQCLFLLSCIEEKDTDLEKPVAELNFPIPCDTIYFDEPFRFSLTISDNTGMGNISMDVHNNFGHHNHGSHETCNMDEEKDAINPYHNNWIIALPEEKLTYTLDTILSISESDYKTDFDSGDYHFHIYITDNEGYQIFTTMDVKMLYRN